MGQKRLFTDLTKAIPSAAITAEYKLGYWRSCEYTAGDISGKLLYTDSRGDTPTLTLPLNLRGWHRVKIGIWGHLHDYHHGYAPAGNRVKLSGAPCFRAFERDRRPPPESISIEDFEVACADLTGQNLLIAPPQRGSDAATNIAYVSCEPLSDREVRDLQADRENADFRKVIAYNDGVGFVTTGEYRNKEDLWELVECYRHSDVESLYWGVMGTSTTFPIEHGRRILDSELGAMGTAGHESFEHLHKNGINPLTTMMEYSQSMGLKFYVYQRMGAWAMPFPHEYASGRICIEHPEWRCINREGIRTPRMSYAFPEVRRQQVEMLAEIASWGPDGIDLNFQRGPAFVCYEEPLVQGFLAEYGEDPRTLDEWDQRWLRYRCRSLTALVRELRAELDAVGIKRGSRVALSVTTFSTELANLFYGLDPETWVKEGLVDRILPWGEIRGLPSPDMAYFRGVVDGTQTELWPHLRVFDDGTDAAYNEIRKKALGFYDSGATGIALWDTCGVDGTSVKGPLLRRFGHIDEMRACVAEEGRRELVLRTIDRLGIEDLRVTTIPETHPERIMTDPYTKHLFMWHG